MSLKVKLSNWNPLFKTVQDENFESKCYRNWRTIWRARPELWLWERDPDVAGRWHSEAGAKRRTFSSIYNPMTSRSLTRVRNSLSLSTNCTNLPRLWRHHMHREMDLRHLDKNSFNCIDFSLLIFGDSSWNTLTSIRKEVLHFFERNTDLLNIPEMSLVEKPSWNGIYYELIMKNMKKRITFWKVVRFLRVSI